jgi:hypothetical protein
MNNTCVICGAKLSRAEMKTGLCSDHAHKANAELPLIEDAKDISADCTFAEFEGGKGDE